MSRRFWVTITTGALVMFGLATTISSAQTALRSHTFEFDPDHTGIVAAAWVHNLGVSPEGAKGRPGLVLSKNGLTATNASAGIVIEGVRGMTLTELGFDVRLGGHCGAGAPRFNVVTSDQATHFVGCIYGTHFANVPTQGWQRVRFTGADAVPAIAAGQTIDSLSIVFDEGTDTGPDLSGLVVLANIDVNGTILPAMSETQGGKHNGRGKHGDHGDKHGDQQGDNDGDNEDDD